MNKKKITLGKYDYRVWAPHFWFLLHTLAYTFTPIKTVDKNSRCNDYGKLEMKYFSMFGDLIPDSTNQMYYKEYAKKNPPDPIIFSSNSDDQYGFFRWTIDIHNYLNKMNGLDELQFDNQLERFKKYHEIKTNPDYIPSEQKKKALLIDYLDSSEASRISDYLIDCNYMKENITLIKDSEMTKINILYSLQNLIIDSWNDSLDEIFLFIRTNKQNEINVVGSGPCIITNDFKISGNPLVIKSSELSQCISKINPDCKVRCIFDTNTPNILQLPVNYQFIDNQFKLMIQNNRCVFNSNIVALANNNINNNLFVSELLDTLCPNKHDTVKNILKHRNSPDLVLNLDRFEINSDDCNITFV